MITQETQTKSPLLLVIASATLLVAAGFSVYLSFSASNIKKTVALLENKKQTLESQTDNSSSSLRARLLTLRGKLDSLDQEQVAWSALVNKIEKTIPRREDGTPVVFIRSYTGGQEGKLSTSFLTDSNAVSPFSDIAQVIRAFATEPSFKDVFVPSINKTLTPDGATVLSFGMTFSYTKREAVESEATGSSTYLTP